MSKIILIMGLPGSGKTTLAYKLKKDLKADWVNADQIRKKYNDFERISFNQDEILKNENLLDEQKTPSEKLQDDLEPIEWEHNHKKLLQN